MLEALICDPRNGVLVFFDSDGMVYRRPVRYDTQWDELEKLLHEPMHLGVKAIDFRLGRVINYYGIDYNTDQPYPYDKLREGYRDINLDLVGKAEKTAALFGYSDYYFFDIDMYELEEKGIMAMRRLKS